MSITSCLASLAPEYDIELMCTTPSTLKEWCSSCGPRTNVAEFVGCAPRATYDAVSLRALLHRGGVKTSVKRFAVGLAEGVC